MDAEYMDNCCLHGTPSSAVVPCRQREYYAYASRMDPHVMLHSINIMNVLKTCYSSCTKAGDREPARIVRCECVREESLGDWTFFSFAERRQCVQITHAGWSARSLEDLCGKRNQTEGCRWGNTYRMMCNDSANRPKCIYFSGIGWFTFSIDFFCSDSIPSTSIKTFSWQYLAPMRPNFHINLNQFLFLFHTLPSALCGCQPLAAPVHTSRVGYTLHDIPSRISLSALDRNVN